MSDIDFRLLVLTAVALIVAGSWWLARRQRVRVSAGRRPDLEPGIHLFSSDTCGSCAPVRDRMRDVFGDEVREIRFEDDPPLFGTFGIAQVPTIIFVDADHQAIAWEGIPTRRQLQRLRRRQGP